MSSRISNRFLRDAVEGGTDAEAIEATMRDILKLRGSVTLAEIGTLPNDGKVIDDIRKFD